MATREGLSNFVRKTLKYKTTTSDYLSNTYQVGEWLGSDGTVHFAKPYLEEIRFGSSAHGYTTKGFASMPDLQLNTLYDADYYYGSYAGWLPDELIDIINYEGVHILNHLGHSWIDKNMKLYISDVDAFTNTDYFFSYSQGCWPGAFEKDCIVERFIKSSTGAFAFIANSRYGWGNKYSTAGPSQYYAREFWDAVFGENKLRLGEANQDSKEDNLSRKNYPCLRWCYLELNLFGDPELALRLGSQGSSVTPPPPVADFGVSERSGKVPHTVNFTDTSTGIITTWHWNFGDGTTSTLQNPSHTYNSAGTFTVSIKVTGPGGSDIETKENYITVTHPPPIAEFNVSQKSGKVPFTVNFTDTSTGIINSWLWNFWKDLTSCVFNIVERGK